ncbi:MAG: hypothetical protein ISR87_00730 [Candidatus Marinimicrobia bacterium]|nr:hypothetical protein [FCB group bacterium]MBL7023950.1 hypothetical protein [Candidatus Neomarinimicrobiota bacterium]
MKLYDGVPFPRLWKSIWKVIVTSYHHKIATLLFILLLGIAYFEGLTKGYYRGHSEAQGTEAVMVADLSHILLLRLAKGEFEEAENTANLLLDGSLRRMYSHDGIPDLPWYIQLDYLRHQLGLRHHDSSAYDYRLKRLAQFRSKHPTEYFNNHEKLNLWLMSYLPGDSTSQQQGMPTR